jgi:phosphatidyl-myo-inositol dimannoside synthase
MSALNGGVLGLFPSFGGVGGVERAGQIVWEGIVNASAGDNHVICYGAPIQVEGNGAGGPIRGTLHQTSSQVMAVAMAASRRWPVQLVFVWHMGMLKMLPFIRTKGSKTVLFLLGIEAWRPVSKVVARLLSRVDLFLTISDFTWETFLKYHPHLSSAAHLTVPLGLGGPIAGVVREPSDPSTALMIGRIARSESYKGHDAVIAAWSKVQNRIPGALLKMIGPCDMREDLLALAERHGVRESVEIVGKVTEEDKARYIAECRCMALPSRAEGFGLVYLEAMRMGRPCVVSNLDAGREVVCPGDGSISGGLAVDPSNSYELASALIRLMMPGAEWNKWSEASRRRYESDYTEAQFHERLIAALTRLS